MTNDIAHLRKEYALATLDEHSVAKDPYTQFGSWLEQAIASGAPEPTAMTLATVASYTHGFSRPSARIVLLKKFDASGLVFFTNYNSRKGRELAANPWASAVFHWVELEREVCVEGRVEKTGEQDSDAYFYARPVASRIGAWASPQSEVIANRSVLERKFEDAQMRFGENVPRPPYWGGYRLLPNLMEFWQGRPNRLHDRIRYQRDSAGWRIERLAP